MEASENSTARTSLAIVSGILVALGYAGCSGSDQLSGPRIVAGLFMGAGMAFSMMRRPARFSPKVALFMVVPLILTLVVYEVLRGTRTEAIVTIAVGVAFVGVQVAFAFLPEDASIGSSSRSESSIPHSEDKDRRRIDADGRSQ